MIQVVNLSVIDDDTRKPQALLSLILSVDIAINRKLSNRKSIDNIAIRSDGMTKEISQLIVRPGQ